MKSSDGPLRGTSRPQSLRKGASLDKLIAMIKKTRR